LSRQSDTCYNMSPEALASTTRNPGDCQPRLLQVPNLKKRTLLFVFVFLFASLGNKDEFANAVGHTWAAQAKPEPLTQAEEELAIVQTLARRYNPSMAFPTRDFWPTSVSYSWHDGSHVMGRVVQKTGKILGEYVAAAHAALDQVSWAEMPNRDDAGNRIEYYVKNPGDGALASPGVSKWLQRWREIMGQVPEEAISEAAYPPTQYAHIFWLNREEGLLGIQYWFYYPFDEWINHHEGDWEHINIVLQGPRELTEDAQFTPRGYQFFFHDQYHEPMNVVRVAGDDPRDDHVMVYTGGHSRFLFWQGVYSGGSYPLPALYPGAGGVFGLLRGPDDDTSRPERFIHARDFDVVVLPEPERLDTERHPELSWLRLPFFAGSHAAASRNPFFIRWFKPNGVPNQPGDRTDWNAMEYPRLWPSGRPKSSADVRLPDGWHELPAARLMAPGTALSRR
jgi:hypothetical protein